VDVNPGPTPQLPDGRSALDVVNVDLSRLGAAKSTLTTFHGEAGEVLLPTQPG